MTQPNIPQMRGNQVPTSTDWNLLREAILTTYGISASPPLAVLRQSNAQNIPTGVWTAISWDSADHDSHAGFSTGTPTRYTAPQDGWYHCHGTCVFAANATSFRAVSFLTNGVGLSRSRKTQVSASSAGATAIGSAATIYLGEGDYVEFAGYQQTGGDISTVVGNDEERSWLQVRLVSL